MNLLHAFLLFAAATTVGAQTDIYKISTEDPKHQVYASVIPIFDSDPQNENPYRVAIRDRQDGKIWGSDISWIDMVTEGAIQDTTAVWSPSGNFVVFHMKPDRRSQTIRTYFIDREHKRIHEVKMPDYIQNMLGRLNRVKVPSYVGEKASFSDSDTISVDVDGWGSGIPSIKGTASIKLHGDPYSEPYGELVSVEAKSGDPQR